MTKLDFLRHAKTRQIHIYARNGIGDSLSFPLSSDSFYDSIRLIPDCVFDAFRVTMTEKHIYLG